MIPWALWKDIFQPTLPHRERRMPPSAPPPTTPKFQPTLPHRERPSHYAGPLRHAADFNPRSRTGSDVETASLDDFDSQNFNPRSRTGSDWSGADGIRLKSAFQPTLPHRERLVTVAVPPQEHNISTHAPAQGATAKIPVRRSDVVFQPTLPHRERQKGAATSAAQKAFQPTLPHRERLGGGGRPLAERHFNPRSRTGSDWRLRSTNSARSTFQPTLPHRERPYLPSFSS